LDFFSRKKHLSQIVLSTRLLLCKCDGFTVEAKRSFEVDPYQSPIVNDTVHQHLQPECFMTGATLP